MTVGVRRPPARRRKRLIGKWSSRKSDLAMWYESSLELDALRLLEWSPVVLRYATQPFRLEYRDGDHLRAYTPDVLVETTTAVWVLEIKPLQETEQTDQQHRFSLISRELSDRGYDFRVITESKIRVQPRLGNIQRLLRYQQQLVPHHILAQAQDWAANTEHPTLGGLREVIGYEMEQVAWCYALLAQHQLTCEIDQPMDDAMGLSHPASKEISNHDTFPI